MTRADISSARFRHTVRAFRDTHAPRGASKLSLLDFPTALAASLDEQFSADRSLIYVVTSVFASPAAPAGGCAVRKNLEVCFFVNNSLKFIFIYEINL